MQHTFQNAFVKRAKTAKLINGKKFLTSELQVGKALNWNGDPGGTEKKQQYEVHLFIFVSCVRSSQFATSGSPALFSLQQLPVGSNLYVQGQLDIEEVLVLLQVPCHLLLQRLDLLLETTHCILVTSSIHGKTVLHLSELAFQRLVLKEKRQIMNSTESEVADCRSLKLCSAQISLKVSFSGVKLSH